MVSYKERKEKETKYVVIKDGIALGVFGSLSRMCKHFENENFPSYSTLSKNKEDIIEAKGYSIQKVKSH